MFTFPLALIFFELDFLALQVDQTWSLAFFVPLRLDMIAFHSSGLNLLHMRTLNYIWKNKNKLHIEFYIKMRF